LSMSEKILAANSAGCSMVKPLGRGLHSFASQLKLSDVYGIMGARRGCVARVKGLLGVVRGVQGGSMCQTRLKLS
jgi:hypothetical protein